MGKYAEDITLLDVCPFSLGVGIEKEQYYDKYGLYMRKVINKGTKLPCKINQIFHPAHENSTSLTIQIYEGDNKFVKDNYPLGKFELLDIPKKKKDEINIDVTFELDEDSILTVTAVIKENNYSNSLTIKNDKGGLSKNEIEKAKLKQKTETIEDNFGPGIVMERNYKNEIHELINQINNSVNPNTQYFYLHNLKYTIEKFIDTFDKNDDNYTLQEKRYYYLTILFNVYSSILVFDTLLSEEEKSDIISRVKEFLQFFERKGLSYASSLIKIFFENEDKIFVEFSVQVLGYYSQKGTEYYSSNEKKYAKHYLEEALIINKKYSVEQRVRKVKNNEELLTSLNSILDNCNELITILKIESIDKYCKSFSNNNLIKEDEFTNDEQKLDILDRFKEAQLLLKDSKKREDKLLKAIYLANIIKIEYKMFNSNDYDTLLKMIEDCINLKVQVPKGCINDTLEWFNEICKYKLEIEQKLETLKDNPKVEEKDIKEDLKDIFDEINIKFNEGRINFFFYILSKHKPNGIEEDMIFNNIDELKNHYNSNEKKFMKQLRKLYNPTRYIGDKEEQRKIHLIMREIQTKINSLK